MTINVCGDCGFIYDDSKEDCDFSTLPDSWTYPVCGAPKYCFKTRLAPDAASSPASGNAGSAAFDKNFDEVEEWLADIHAMAETGESLDEAMRTRKPVISWDDILFKGGQLAHPPLLQEEPIATRTIIGPKAKIPLVLESPLYVSHMSFGSLSVEAKTALAKGSALVKTAMCSGEGGIIEESIGNAYKNISLNTCPTFTALRRKICGESTLSN